MFRYLRLTVRNSPHLRVPCLLLAAALAVLLAGCGKQTSSTNAVRPVLVTRPGNADGLAQAYAGEIRAQQESPLAFRVSGKIVARRVDIGDRVRQGDLLARLDASDLQAQLRAAKAQLAAAEAEWQRADADQARYAKLAKQGVISESAMDAHTAATIAAEGQVDAARAQMQLAENQLAYSELRAPADGAIVARHAEAGQVVGAGQPVFTLAAEGVREVAFAVPEGAVDKIYPGQSVTVELWSEPGKRWPGKVREVAPAADPASRTYAVRATIKAPVEALDLGQSAQVFVDGGSAEHLSVPLAALQRVGEGRFAVFVVDPDTSTLRLQAIEIGEYGNDTVPVEQGLSADALVVAAGGHLLREGQKVRPVDRNNKPVLD